MSVDNELAEGDPVPIDNDWSQPEIVRNLHLLTEAIQRLTNRFDALDQRFITRELYQERHLNFTSRIDENSRRINALEGELTLLRRELADRTLGNWRFWTSIVAAPIFVGILVSAVVSQMIG